MGKRFVDLDTGEIIEDVVGVLTGSEERKKAEFKQKQQSQKKFRKVVNKHCGNFYFYRYDKLLQQLNDDTATAFRFLYLCACADKDGYFLKYENAFCKTKDDFTYIFDRPSPTTRKYIDDLTKYKLLNKDNKGYMLNPIFYSVGLNDDFKKNSIRTFNKAIKELYYNSDPKEHKSIGKLLKLVPYINIYNNVLCWDIEITDKDLIQPLTIEEIREILHPGNNYNYDVFNKLETLFIKGEPVIGRFNSVKQEQYIINPRLFYRGNDVRDLQAIIDQFDIAKNQYLRKVNKKQMLKGGN